MRSSSTSLNNGSLIKLGKLYFRQSCATEVNVFRKCNMHVHELWAVDQEGYITWWSWTKPDITFFLTKRRVLPVDQNYHAPNMCVFSVLLFRFISWWLLLLCFKTNTQLMGSLYACWLGCDLESRGIEARIPAWIRDFSLRRVQVRYGISQVPYSKNSGGTAAGSPRSSTRLGMRGLLTSSSIRLYAQCMINTSDTTTCWRLSVT
jgi:hypothetical protein